MEPDLNPYAAPSTPGDLTPLPTDVLGGRLRVTAIGLRLVFFGALIVLVAWLAGIAVAISDRGNEVTTVLASIAMLGAVIVNCGPLLCTTVPAGYGLKSFAMATVVAQASAMVMFLGAFFLYGFYFSIAAVLLAVVAASLFLFFLCRLSQCLKRDDLVRRGRTVSMLWSAVIFSFFPISYLSDLFSFELGLFLWIGYLAVFASAMVFYAWFNNAVSNAIGKPVVSDGTS